MIKSMTGFGRGEYRDEKYHVVVEMKTVNHRYVDFSIRMPRVYGFLEDNVRKEIRQMVRRGKVDVFISVENLSQDIYSVVVNEKLVREYGIGMETISEIVPNEIKSGITAEFLATLPEVMTIKPKEEDEDAVSFAILNATEKAAKALNSMRIEEGTSLAADLSQRGTKLREILDEMRAIADRVPELYKVKLKERIDQLLEPDSEITQERLAMEVAIFADKANVDEELTRLDSHIKQLEKSITDGENHEECHGKRLDFLVQEMNREANTIGSKANGLELVNLVINAKAEIEKIREQVQNIE